MKKEKRKQTQEKESNSYWLPIGMCIGISIGTAIGASTNNIGLWLPIGLSIGLCLGVALSNMNNDKDKK